MFLSFLNPQGNFDPAESYWASHPDFGGQLVYVKELAKEMAAMGHQVDIVTRKIVDPEWPEFEADFDYYPGIENIRIVRIDFGPSGFIKKEELWPYICPEYVEKLIALYKKEKRMPDFVTAHYGDGGLAAAYFKEKTGIPYTFTGHSLGAQKMEKFNITKYNIERYNNTYNFASRLTAERIGMNRAFKVVTSTVQERFSQYTHTAYNEALVPGDENKFSVIPPGVSLRVFDKEAILGMDKELNEFILTKLKRDLDPDRVDLPAIISSSRLDPKKNVTGIVKAYGLSSALQKKSNLVIITKGHNNPLKSYGEEPGEDDTQGVLKEILSLVDVYNLRGKISMFSIDSQRNLSAMYRYFASTGSVFCLAALYEPFGLAPLEAMACGLPVVTTKFGGPAESLREKGEEFGILVDPNLPDELAGGLYKLINSKEIWEDYSVRGYKRILDKYTWRCTALSYLEVFKSWDKKKTYTQPFQVEIDKYFLKPSK
ncbi:MAG: glycosyltransferase family 1 protein [Elusimicrobia bacterium]|nr:glycosyltransferase family 1 protein [Elusimicrobiota bacterium]